MHRDLDVFGDRPHDRQRPAQSPSRSAAVYTPTTPGIAAAASCRSSRWSRARTGVRTTRHPHHARHRHVVDVAAPAPVSSFAVLLAKDAAADVRVRGRHRSSLRPSRRSSVRRHPGSARRCSGSRCSGRGCPRATRGRPPRSSVGFSLQVADRRHDHARRAVPALQAVVAWKASCKRVHLAARRPCPSIVVTSRPSACSGEHRAGLHRLAVDEHRAGAARGGVAADVGAGEPKLLPEEVDEQRSRFHVGVLRRAVHSQGHLGHGEPPSSVRMSRGDSRG